LNTAWNRSGRDGNSFAGASPRPEGSSGTEAQTDFSNQSSLYRARGTRNVYQACVDSGVRRLVFASSNHVTGLYENDPPYSHIVKGEYDKVDAEAIPLITHESLIRPDSHYGVSKAYGETLGRFHSEEHGLSVSCLRIGSLRPIDNPFGAVRFYATWQSHRDLAQQVRKSLERDIGFGVFYGVSDNKWRFWGIDRCKDVIGYRPRDNAEEHRAAEK